MDLPTEATAGAVAAAVAVLTVWIRHLWSNRVLRKRIVGAAAEVLTDGDIEMDPGKDPTQTSLDALRSAVEGLSQTVSTQGEHLERSDARISALEAKVAKREARIAALEKQLAETKRQLAEAHADRDALSAKVREMETELASLRAARAA